MQTVKQLTWFESESQFNTSVKHVNDDVENMRE